MARVIRLFLAAHLPDPLRARLGELTAAARATGGAVRWVRPEHQHLTLRFLGDTPPELVPRLEQAVAAATLGFGPVALTVGGVGRFPARGRPSVLWLGLGGEVERLGALAARLEAAAVALGYVPETQPFSPHLTVARVKHGAAAATLEALAHIGDLGAWELDRVTLVRSTLGSEGPTYEDLATFPLAGRGQDDNIPHFPG